MYRFLLLFFLSFLSLVSQGQAIKGTVVDAETSEPIVYANVFLNNTSMGTSTNENGYFNFKGKPGFYQLVVSVIGYEKYIAEVSLDKSSSISLDITLTTLPQQLDEVIVNPDTTGWKHNYDVFFKTLIGTSTNASDCHIKNPRSILFYYNPKKNTLEAYAHEPLKIINEALGYEIEYWLEEFKVDFNNNFNFFYGLPAFVKMSGSKRKQRKWKRNRIKAYHGSMLELGRLLYAKADLPEHGWRANKITRTQNLDRPSDEYIKEKIRSHAFKNNGKLDMNNDSVKYYKSLSRLPRNIYQLTKQDFDFSQVITTGDQSNKLHYKGGIQFVYTLENQEQEYYGFLSKNHGKKLPQTTVMWFLASEYKIYENGNIVDINDYYLEGYMGWSEKLCNMLPLDYKVKDDDI